MQERSISRVCSLSLCRPHRRLPWFLTGKELSSYMEVGGSHSPAPPHPQFVEGKCAVLGG